MLWDSVRRWSGVRPSSNTVNQWIQHQKGTLNLWWIQISRWSSQLHVSYCLYRYQVCWQTSNWWAANLRADGDGERFFQAPVGSTAVGGTRAGAGDGEAAADFGKAGGGAEVSGAAGWGASLCFALGAGFVRTDSLKAATEPQSSTIIHKGIPASFIFGPSWSDPYSSSSAASFSLFFPSLMYSITLILFAVRKCTFEHCSPFSFYAVVNRVIFFASWA